MDFISRLPKSSKFDSIMVVVIRLTKFSHFIPLSHPFTAEEVVAVFIKEIIKLLGFPRIIVADRDKIFKRKFWQELIRFWGLLYN